MCVSHLASLPPPPLSTRPQPLPDRCGLSAPGPTPGPARPVRGMRGASVRVGRGEGRGVGQGGCMRGVIVCARPYARPIGPPGAPGILCAFPHTGDSPAVPLCGRGLLPVPLIYERGLFLSPVPLSYERGLLCLLLPPEYERGLRARASHERGRLCLLLPPEYKRGLCPCIMYKPDETKGGAVLAPCPFG